MQAKHDTEKTANRQTVRTRSLSLNVKIIFSICAAILPLCLLVFLSSHSLMQNEQEALVTSFSNELSLYMAPLDAQLSGLTAEMDMTMGRRWQELARYMRAQDMGIGQYDLLRDVETARSANALASLSYVKTGWNNACISSYDTERHTYYEYTAILAYLTDCDLTSMSHNAYEYVRIDGAGYLILNANFSQISFGLLLPVDTLLAPLESMRTYASEAVLLADGASVIQNGTVYSVDASEQTTINIGDEIIVSRAFDSAPFRVVRTVQRSEIQNGLPATSKLLMAMAVISLLVIPLMLLLLRRLILVPLRDLNEALHRLAQGDLAYRMNPTHSSSELEYIGMNFNHMTDEIQRLTIESYEKDLSRLRIEADNIRLQVNPHMLLNSINLINSLAKIKENGLIEEYTIYLSEYLRYSLRSADALVPLRSELDFVRNYVAIQEIRFPNLFTTVYEVDPSLLDTMVLPQLILNFVENAIKYGIDMDNVMRLTISAKEEDGFLCLKINDTGNGMDAQTLEQIRACEPVYDMMGKHIGIWNSRGRMNLLYGDASSLDVESSPGEGTRVTIRIPLSTCEIKN